MVRQRLIEVSARMKRLHEDLRVADEQLAHFADDADTFRRAIGCGLRGRQMWQWATRYDRYRCAEV